jgi:hypothetical protein
MFALRTVAGILTLALCLGTAAKADTYEITVYPQMLADFYGPGENANTFTSTYWSILETGAVAPPQFSFVQFTFSTSDIGNDQGLLSPNVQVYIPELNDFGPIPKGQNLAPQPSPYSASLDIIPGTESGSTEDEYALQLETGGFGLQTWDFFVYFPAGTVSGSGVNDPNTVMRYTDVSSGTPEVMAYDFASSTMQEVPEPSSLGIVIAASIAGGAALRRKRQEDFR